MTRERSIWQRDRYAAPRSAARHPFLVSLLTGLSVGLSPALWYQSILICVLIGIGGFLLSLLFWMPWGPGGRWVSRLPPYDGS